MKLSMWDKFNYDITYIDPIEMSQFHVLTNVANLGIIIDEIIDKGGFDIRVQRIEN